MSSSKKILELETAFWKSMVDQDTDSTLKLLPNHSAMVTSHGANHFDQTQYKKMAEEGPMKLTSFKFSDEKVYFPTPDIGIVTYTVHQGFEVDGKQQKKVAYDSTTWVNKDGSWVAALHTETPQHAKRQ